MVKRKSSKLLILEPGQRVRILTDVWWTDDQNNEHVTPGPCDGMVTAIHPKKSGAPIYQIPLTCGHEGTFLWDPEIDGSVVEPRSTSYESEGIWSIYEGSYLQPGVKSAIPCWCVALNETHAETIMTGWQIGAVQTGVVKSLLPRRSPLLPHDHHSFPGFMLRTFWLGMRCGYLNVNDLAPGGLGSDLLDINRGAAPQPRTLQRWCRLNRLLGRLPQ